MRVLKINEKKNKPRKIPSFLLEKRKAEAVERKQQKIEHMIEAKVAQALRLLR